MPIDLTFQLPLCFSRKTEAMSAHVLHLRMARLSGSSMVGMGATRCDPLSYFIGSIQGDTKCHPEGDILAFHQIYLMNSISW